MSEQDAFLLQILEDPDDDATRLVYADWLEEQGDPRGEFIQIQCQLAQPDIRPSRRKQLRKREQELFSQNWLAWTAENGRVVRRQIFRRGFLDEATISLRSFIKHAPTLFAAAPLRHVTLTAGATLLGKLATMPELVQLRSIRFKGNGFDDAGIVEFTQSPYVHKLERLILTNQEINLKGLAAIAQTPNFASLRSLDLSLNHFTIGTSELYDSPMFPRLREFHFRGNSIDPSSFRRLCSLPPLTNLELLDLSFSLDQGAYLGEDFAQSESFPALRRACFNGCNLSSQGIRYLTENRNLPNLNVLEFRWNNVDDIGANALAESPMLAQLTRISLNGNRITRAGAEAIGSSPFWKPGTQLALSNNRIRHARDVEALKSQFGRSFGQL